MTVVVIRLGAMGDILRTLPPVRLLRQGIPRARLLWAVEDGWTALLEGHRDLDGVIRVPRRTWRRLGRAPIHWPSLWGSIRDFRRELRGMGSSLALDFHGNLRSGLICRWTGAPVRIGYTGHQQKEGNHWFTTHRVASGERRTPRMERNLDLVRALGLPDGPLPDGGLPLVEAGTDRANRLLRDLVPEAPAFAVVSPGASRAQAYKKPPVELLAAACRLAARRGLKPLVVYGPGEEEDARRVVTDTGESLLAPPTDLATLAALLRRARLFIGGDSGPMHMACAVGCPVLALYGPTDPRVNRPWGVTHRAVSPAGRDYTGIKRIDRSAGGFSGLTTTDVEVALSDLLEELAARGGANPGDGAGSGAGR